MANDVYANNNEISCKSADGKSICCFPDVCMTPPENPATPPGVPIPYPNTGMASDMTEGSRTVQISGKEIMLKNKSYFKKSLGDEAGCAAKKGVVTSVNRGKVYFVAWSMDVKVEGENSVRNLDMTTHNHASPTPNTMAWCYVDTMAAADAAKCAKDRQRERQACGYDEASQSYTRSDAQNCKDKKCQEARKCMLVPYGSSGSPHCCPDQTAHHMVEGHGLQEPGGGALGKFPNYRYSQAPCVCAKGDRWTAEHGSMHQKVGRRETRAVRNAAKRHRSPDYAWNYKEAKGAAISAHEKTFAAGCTRDCLEAQLDAFHNGVGCYDHSLLRTYDVEAAGHI